MNYLKADEMGTNIRDYDSYVKQAKAIKFDGIITGKKTRDGLNVGASDVDSMYESIYLVVGESKTCHISGKASFDTHIPKGQEIRSKTLVEVHKAFTYYKFGTENHTSAVMFDCPFFRYRRHDQSYYHLDCPTTNAYIAISLYHQIATLFSAYSRDKINIKYWEFTHDDKLDNEARMMFDYLFNMAVYEYHENGMSLVIPSDMAKLSTARRNAFEHQTEFYDTAKELMECMLVRARKGRIK